MSIVFPVSYDQEERMLWAVFSRANEESFDRKIRSWKRGHLNTENSCDKQFELLILLNI